MLTSSDVLPRVGTPLFAKFLLKWKLDRVGFISGSTCVKIRKNIGTYNGELYSVIEKEWGQFEFGA
jgi:hypothetical protein